MFKSIKRCWLVNLYIMPRRLIIHTWYHMYCFYCICKRKLIANWFRPRRGSWQNASIICKELKLDLLHISLWFTQNKCFIFRKCNIVTNSSNWVTTKCLFTLSLSVCENAEADIYIFRNIKLWWYILYSYLYWEICL